LSQTSAIMGLGESCPNASKDLGCVFSLGAGVPTPSPVAPDIDDLDEALYWASITPNRGEAWRQFVDQLLDTRTNLTQGGGTHVSQS
jgi:hypothetical protein